MRLLRSLLIALSLAWGVGGFAHRPLADEGEPSTTPAVAPANAAAIPPGGQAADSSPLDRVGPAARVPGSCRQPDPMRPVAIADDTGTGEDVITLNTRGYNHRQPGQVETIIPDVSGTKHPEGYPRPEHDDAP